MEPHDELREAASKLTHMAKGCTAAPWTWRQFDGAEEVSGGLSVDNADGLLIGLPETTCEAAWMATIGPNMAEPLAVLLRNAADTVQRSMDAYGAAAVKSRTLQATQEEWLRWHVQPWLDVARQINREAGQ